MALSLEEELHQLDTQIAGIRDQREASHDKAERARLDRSIEMLDVHERAAIKKVHTERAEREAAQQKAADDFQQQQAAKQEASDRAMLRRRWTGDQASFDAAYPELIKQLRMDRALGRDIASDIPSSQVAF